MEENTIELTQESAQALSNIAPQVIYLMGGSFILGCLFTIFILLILDFMRQVKTSRDEDIDAI